jgi:hypothetical protein
MEMVELVSLTSSIVMQENYLLMILEGMMQMTHVQVMGKLGVQV